jgi:lysophospholipase L1-like esterase
MPTNTTNDATRNYRKKRLLAKVLLILGGLVIGLFMAEMVLRVIGYSYPLFYTADYYRGYAPRPGIEGWFWAENKVYIRINSAGLRDREHSKSKPPNTIRIAVLGDSFAEAKQVELEQTFWAVMEQGLQQCQTFAGKKVEVLNFGVGGYGTAQELLTLRQQVWEYSPDVVVLMFTTFNDIMDNYRPLKEAVAVPYFVYEDGKLVYDTTFRNSSTYRWRDAKSYRFGRWFRDRLRFTQLIHHAHSAIRAEIASRRSRNQASQFQQRNGATRNPQTQNNNALSEEIGRNNIIYRGPDDSTWTEAWRVTEGLIAQVSEDVKLRGAKFLLVTLSTDLQVYPDKAVRQAFIERVGLSDLFYPNRRLKSLAELEGMPFLDLAEPMQAYADQNRVFLYGFGSQLGSGHWNETGHRLAGQLITQRLCEGGLD